MNCWTDTAETVPVPSLIVEWWLVDRKARRTGGGPARGRFHNLAGLRPMGTSTVTCVSESTVNLVAATPSKVTFVVCSEQFPFVPGVPTGPLGGPNPVLVGSMSDSVVAEGGLEVCGGGHCWL